MKNADSFYREATECICSSLDIVESMEALLKFLQKSMPVKALIIALACPLTKQSMGIQVGELHLGYSKTSFRGDFSDEKIERMLYLHEFFGDKPLFSVCNTRHEFPEWVQELYADPVTDEHLNGSSPAIIARFMLSNTSLGIMWFIGTENTPFTQEHADLLALLHNPIAIAISSRMRTLEAENLHSTLADERRLFARQLGDVEAHIIGADKGLQGVIQAVRHVAPTLANVMILGETGTGKELIAKAVHELSTRKESPLVTINCAALPETLLESELFGHAKGAFTGATTERKGFFEIAHNGTIFLDEVAEMSLQAQAKLLRLIQESELIRLGETQVRKINVRIIAATNKDLHKEVQNGKFREDLFYRLNAFVIHIPPLRERKEDIQELICHFITKYAKKHNKQIPATIPADELEKACLNPWLGNVRELEFFVERAVINAHNAQLNFDFEPLPLPQEQHATRLESCDEAMRNLIGQALKQAKGKIAGKHGAAALLQVHPNTLRNRMDKLGITYKKNAYFS